MTKHVEAIGHPDLKTLGSILGSPVVSWERFPVGLCHRVYKLSTSSDSYVLRVAHESTAKYLKGTRHWIGQLAPLGLPIPELVYDGSDRQPPFQILSMMPGRDLGEVYPRLANDQKRSIAAELIEMQRRVASLPRPRHYGYMFSYEDGEAAPNWETVIFHQLAGSIERLRENGVFETRLPRQLQKRLEDYRGYFSRIRPVAFLADATTKNVLVEAGRVSGLVDLDEVCFGDWLTWIALTHVALAGDGHDTVYAEELERLADLDEGQTGACHIYKALFAVDLMAEVGMAFNREAAVTASDERKMRLEAMLETNLTQSSRPG